MKPDSDLDAAIVHAEKAAEDRVVLKSCQREHAQLASWLKELRELRYQVHRYKELYESAMSVTRKLQEERDGNIRRVEAALLGIKGVG